MKTPLRRGEHGDLDSGTAVSRSVDAPMLYELKHDGASFELFRGEIRQIAELAGFVVIEDAGSP